MDEPEEEVEEDEEISLRPIISSVKSSNKSSNKSSFTVPSDFYNEPLSLEERMNIVEKNVDTIKDQLSTLINKL